jgi:predicted oxidoreductase
MTDTTTMSGAQFQRAVGTDPAKWAEAFVRSTAGEMSEAEILERASWVTPWFRDYAEVCVAEEVGRVTAPIVAGRDRLGPGQG